MKLSSMPANKFSSSRKQQRLDKNVIMASVMQNGLNLYYANDEIKSNKDIAMAAVKQNGMALEYANEDMILPWLRTVKEDGLALYYANDDVKSEKDIVMIAVQQNGTALVFANDDMRSDKEVVMAYVKRNGMALEFASDLLRSDKEVVCAAVQNNPDALKFAKGGLHQTSDCWIAAGLWNQQHPQKQQPIAGLIDHSPTINVERPRVIVLSTRFSLQEDSKSPVTKFTKLLNESPYIRNGNFVIYSPNAFEKGSCDPKWTRISWPCRGTFDSCQFLADNNNNNVKDDGAEPNDKSCWRYSFRCHLEVAKKTNGIMIQVVDYGLFSCLKCKNVHALGGGQEIEKVMAAYVGTKTFRLYQPFFDVDHLFSRETHCYYPFKDKSLVRWQMRGYDGL